MGYSSRALDLTSEDDLPARFELLLAREGTYDLLGAREAQRQDPLQLAAAADALQDDRKRTDVALRQARWFGRISDNSAAIRTAKRAVRLAQNAADLHRQASGYAHWGMALHGQGDYEGAEARFEEALKLAQGARPSESGPLQHVDASRRLEADGLCHLDLIRGEQGDYAEGRAYCEQALRIYREIGDQRGGGMGIRLSGHRVPVSGRP